MPFKSERIKIAGSKYDRRIKLTQKDKDDIRNIRGMSIGAIARKYGVSKRLIGFILHPEKHIENLKLRAERGGTMFYYNKEKQRVYAANTRNYKQRLYVNGEIFLDEK